MATNSKSIYDTISSEADLQKFITEQTTEGLYLEFKQKADPTVPDLADGDKKHFGEALSQFANSDGGVLVFGMKTDKPNDTASSLIPIQQHAIFSARLSDYLLHAVQPSVDKIESKIIDHDKNSGYVIFHIPTSLKTPHRATLTREYLKRSQTGKVKLEHFDLEDMFGRRQKPHLILEIIPSTVVPTVSIDSLRANKLPSGHLGGIQYDLFITNEGRYVGKHVMLVITGPSEQYAKIQVTPLPSSGASLAIISSLRGNQPTFQINMTNSIFYPEIGSRVGTLDVMVAINEYDIINQIPIGWALYAEDMTSAKGEIILDFKTRVI